MYLPSKPKVVLLGMMTKMPVAGVVWQNVHYLVGFERLGCEVYYVEEHARTPSMFMETEQCDGSAKAAAFIDQTMRRFDLGDRWCLHALHEAEPRCFGKNHTQLRELYASANLIINLHGGTIPLPEHYATGRLVYLETDPVQLQIELHDNRQETIDFLEPHCAFFTFGENIGAPDCGLPVPERFEFKPTRQPVVLDIWHPHDCGPAEVFTSIGNWEQRWREVWFKGERYTWSKHHEFLKFIDLPSRTPQRFELALASCPSDAKALLEGKGWAVRDAMDFSTNADAYRRYVAGSRGEFTVAKDQNVRLRSGWFSDRSATYLAAGRPVVTQETGFSNILPTGAGLFCFSNMADVVEAFAHVETDYKKHCRAAVEIANAFFDSDKVLRRLLDDLDTKTGGPAVSPKRSNLRQYGAERVLLASCLGDGDTGGGIFACDGPNFERVDRLSSTGLFVAGERLHRLLWASNEIGGIPELIIYDAKGVERYYRLDGLSAVHDTAWDGESVIIVSTGTNDVVWLAPDGQASRVWNAPGEGDSWHLNSLLIKDGRLFAAAFGRFEKRREWNGHKQDGSGVVFDVATGENVITGLACPHNPCFFDGAWAVCNSATSEFLRIDPFTGAIMRRLKLNGWTRGVALSDELIFVGESANRHHDQQGETASVAVISRQSWELLDRLPLPCREVYDLVLAPAELAAGVRRGFRTNPLRVAEQDQYALFQKAGVEPVRLWATGERLPKHACRVKIGVELPATMQPNCVLEIPCAIENTGGAILVSSPPYPVYVSYKWLDPASRQRLPGIEGLRTPLPRSLPAREPVDCALKIKAPPTEGEFLLSVTLVQEQVAWFDDLHRGNAACGLVRVVHTPAAEEPAIDEALAQPSAK